MPPQLEHNRRHLDHFGPGPDDRENLVAFAREAHRGREFRLQNEIAPERPHESLASSPPASYAKRTCRTRARKYPLAGHPACDYVRPAMGVAGTNRPHR